MLEPSLFAVLVLEIKTNKLLWNTVLQVVFGQEVGQDKDSVHVGKKDVWEARPVTHSQTGEKTDPDRVPMDISSFAPRGSEGLLMVGWRFFLRQDSSFHMALAFILDTQIQIFY